MKIVKGNLIDLAKAGQFDVIIHGCNCAHKFGAGIAREIRDRYPEAYAADLATPRNDRTKLGTYSKAVTQDGFVIINGYTQFWVATRVGQCVLEYDALESVFRGVASEFPLGTRFGYPKIGAGLAGGDWDRISNIINDAMGEHDHTLVVL